MGTSSLFDILGSVLIGGLLMLMVINVNGNLSKVNYSYGSEMTVQRNLVTLVGMVEQDFRRIGYCATPYKFPDPGYAILAATQTSIKFLGDYNADGNLDTISYWVGDTLSANMTKNPHDKLLYKKINSQPTLQYNLGVVTFNFTYYGAYYAASLGNLADTLPFPINIPVGAKSGIFMFQLSVLLQSPEAYDTSYQYAYWRQLRLTSINLRNR